MSHYFPSKIYYPNRHKRLLVGFARLMGLMGLLVLPLWAQGEIYKWVDKTGKVHFGDQKPEQQAAEEVTVEINTYTNVTYDESIFDFDKKEVVLFSTSWCSYCKKAKAYFRQQNIPYHEYDIEKSQRARQLYDRMGATGIPVILVGKKRMNGFNVSGFNKIYQQD